MGANNYSTIDHKVGGYMSGDGGHGGGDHGAHGGASHGAAHSGGKKRELHTVDKNHQDLYDKIVESFDPEFHRTVTKKHNKAYGKVVGELAETFDSEDDAVKAFGEALIKYRKEAGLPVSDKDEHKTLVYREVREMFKNAKEGRYGDKYKAIENMYKAGNLMEFFSQVHRTETTKTVLAKIDNDLHDLIPEDEEPDLYQGLLKAHGNYTGRTFTKGELASAGNRESLLEAMKGQYDQEINRQIMNYTKRKTTEHAHGGHAANNTKHYNTENKHAA